MTLEEANKIIAEFMGWYKQYTERHPDAWNNSEGFRVKEGEWFSQSLDALVPVWEKLKMFRVTLEYFDREEKSADMDLSHNHTAYGKTIQEAACISTALKILDLELEDLE